MSEYRFSLGECRALSSRAWAIRKLRASASRAPVLSVSWKACLLEAKKASLISEAARVASELRDVFGASGAFVNVNPFPVCLPAFAPVSSSRFASLPRFAVAVLALVLV
jgi:hypothetical protein